MEYFVQSDKKSSEGFTDTINCEKWGIENMKIGERATVLCFPFKDSTKVFVYGVFENNGTGKFATWFQVKREIEL